MADEPENGTQPAPAAAPAPNPDLIRVQIDFNPANSQLFITGPVENLPLFLGMLETAKFIVLQERVKAASKTSIIPGMTPFDPNMLKRH